jgi:hypothetical protein
MKEYVMDGHVACMEKLTDAQNMLIENSEEKTPVCKT